MQNFNDTEALKISREIELRGADIYARALRIAKKPDVRQMLDHLRKEELEHAALNELQRPDRNPAMDKTVAEFEGVSKSAISQRRKRMRAKLEEQ